MQIEYRILFRADGVIVTQTIQPDGSGSITPAPPVNPLQLHSGVESECYLPGQSVLATRPGGGFGDKTDPGGGFGDKTDPGGGFGDKTDPGGGFGDKTDPGGGGGMRPVVIVCCPTIIACADGTQAARILGK